MYLKGLRLKGFKSFATPTSLLFEPGVGVIIGPNGSGKSNLADAVVWALGEQSPTALRGSSMQDVIFAGSDGRRPLASAEVELTFDNSDGALPLPTPEVSVMRRVTRDGASQYSINHSNCRLTDVIELLAPLGLGRELHSIIGQGKVEAFLAGKPEDRRAQIEEAAGLGAFKRRRERAEIKLREVRRNLERAALLEREVEAQLSPLRRQATAAEQLADLEREMAGIKARLVAGALAEVEAEAGAHAAELATLADRRRRNDEGLAAVAAARLSEEEAFTRRLAERERRAQRLLRARVVDTRLDSARRLTSQRAQLAAEMERAALAERERLLHELAAADDERPRDEWPELERRLQEELAAAGARHAELRRDLDEARGQSAARQAALQTALLAREAALAEAARLERRLSALATEESALRAREGRAGADAAAARNAEEAAAGAEEAAREELREAAAQSAAAAQAAATAAEREREADARQRGAAQAARNTAGEIEHLRAALRDLEDVDPAVLAVAREHGDAASVALLLRCEPGYERALAAALAHCTGALALPPDTDKWALLASLEHRATGLARLVTTAPPRRPALFAGARYLTDVVDTGQRAELESLLSEVVLVDDLQAVPPTFAGLAVTRDGTYWRPLAGQLGLAAGLPAALLFERRTALARLEQELDARQRRAPAAESELEVARRESAAARQESSAAAAAEHAARRGAEAAGRAHGGARARRRELEAARARDLRAAEGIAGERAEIAGIAGHAAEAAAEAERRLTQLRPEAEAAAAAALAAERAAEAGQTELTRRRVELEEQRAAARRAAERAAAARRRSAAGRARIAELDERLVRLPAQRAACEELLRGIDVVHAAARTTLAGLSLESGPDPAQERAELHTLAAREAGLRRALDEDGERRTVLQVALARLDDRRQELTGKLAEVRHLAPDAAPPADQAEEQSLAERLERLARRRERLGPVNPLAAAECAELEERAGFLREQRRDLEHSVRDLNQLIKELTEHVDAEFAETFAAVSEQFRHMVALLFPGGRGSLELVEPTEEGTPGGVNVQVKPAKKLGQRLQLLSGGERALVAIAFLMALVLARPSPLYILDEIEAALDDVNIGRLVQLLREYRQRTQFLVITHQKRTMDAADVLYGVTMGPDGASQVVSARMAAAAIEREAQAQHAEAPPARG